MTCLIILAGGNSTRFEYNKCSILTHKICSSVSYKKENTYISVNNILKAHSIEEKKYHFIEDTNGNYGPMRGIYSSILFINRNKKAYKRIIFIATDIPNIDRVCIDRIVSEYEQHIDIVCAETENRKYHMCFSIRICQKTIEICRNSYSLKQLLNNCNTKYVTFDNTNYFKNVNTKEDYIDYITTIY